MSFEQQQQRKKFILITLLVLVVVAIIYLCWDFKSQTNKKKKKDTRKRSLSYEETRFIIVRNYNVEGGFFWVMYNVLCAARVAEQLGFRLIIYLDKGFYLETNPKYIEQFRSRVDTIEARNNWFAYYFKKLEQDDYLATLYVLSHEKEFRSLKWFAQFEGKEPIPHRFYQWDREAFETSLRNGINLSTFHFLTEKYLVPLSYIKQICDEYCHKFQFDKYYMISCHIRLSDKVANKDSTEDNNAHLPYTYVSSKLAQFCEEIEEKELRKVKVFICTDEQPLIEYLDIHLHYPKCYTSSLRSTSNTGGLQQGFEDCTDSLPLSVQPPHCKRYKELAGESIHRGYSHLSSFQKGQDVLVDVLLLARCRLFLSSRGNVSSFPPRFNPNLEVIDLVALYQQEQKT
jgi:hypothetical protein